MQTDSIVNDYVNRTEDGTCTCRNPNCPTHDLISDGLMRAVPCDEGEIIVCGFCSNEKEKRGPCKLLGEYLNRTKAGVACRGTVKIKLFECAIHKICSINKPVGWHCCHSCGDYEEKSL